MKARFGTMVAAATLVVMVATPAYALITPTKVLGGREAQYGPFSDGTFLLWYSNSTRAPNHYDALAKRLGGSYQFRLNVKGTEGAPGGFSPGTDQVVYQQWRNDVSDLYLYDLSERTRKPIGAVNTRQWEWTPRLSTRFLLFTRSDFTRDRDRLVLYKRSTGFPRTLMDIDNSAKRLVAESVGERYATWSVCGNRSCAAYMYDSMDGSLRRLPDDGRLVYASAVDEALGAVYFVRSGIGCGSNVSIWKMPIAGGVEQRIVDLPPGVDVSTTSIAPAPSDHVDLLFDRIVCHEDSDIYKAKQVDTIPV